MRGPLNLAGGHDLLPGGTIEVSPARELTALGSIDVAYEADGAVAIDSLKRPLLALGYGPIPESLPQPPAETREEEVVWGGELVNQFGHFLIESTTRLWPLIAGGELEGLPVVFKARKGQAPPFVHDWLEGFGAETILLPAEGAVRFRRMHVPEQSWRLGAWIAPELRETHLQARAGLELPSVARRDVLWMSRSRLAPDRIPYDEGLLEWILGDHVTPVHLEAMTLAEQVATLEGSRAVTGVMGSAFHALLLSAGSPDCLYLCPSFAKGPYTAQHQVLGSKATFVETMAPTARVRRLRREGFLFPGGHRILIPETLAALDSTVLPGLLDDPRLAAFADPQRSRDHAPDEFDTAVIRALREPYSAQARRALAAGFAELGLDALAGEQSRLAADLEE